MNNVVDTTEVSLTLFGGTNTELDPTDLPMGLSYDSPNCAFIPGKVFTRPPLQRLSTLGTAAQIVYATSFIKEDGAIVQLRFDSLGGIYADGVKVGQTAAGNRFQVANVFGKAYIAISDGLHGADVPLQFDGTNLDRVSQDGPGGGVTLANYGLPGVALAVGTVGSPVAIATAMPINPTVVQVSDGGAAGRGEYLPPQFETYYTALQYTTVAAHGLTAGATIVVTGNTLYDAAAATVQQVIDATNFTIAFYGQDDAPGSGGTVAAQGALLSRTGGVVSVSTASPHGMRVGYSFSISGTTALAESIVSIAIDTDALPGVAVVTTSTPHGFVPGTPLTITGVASTEVGGGITGYSIDGAGTATVTTASAHRLVVGEIVVISLGPSGGQVSLPVSAVVSATVFTVSTASAASSGAVGTLMLAFSLGTNYTVASVPTPTTFQVTSSYFTGTWNSGTIQYAWDGTFFVASVLSATSFTYAQSGPDALVATGTVTMTPLGQIAPGRRKCVVIFQTRTGYLTVPGPIATFTASGGQYLFVSNIPLGPPNVIARWLAFTGANGGEYFCLPVAPQQNGQVIGTATVIADNTTTSAIFDFADQALLAGIDIGPKFAPGNNLFRQEVLGPCLGFYAYASRLLAWGERNKVQSFWNMGFEGGTQASAPNVPLGWNLTGAGTLTTAGDYGVAWQPTGGASLSQNAFQDENGAPILAANTQYKFRCWTTGTTTATLASLSTSFSATAAVTSASGFGEALFSLKTPIVMPPDLVLTVTGSGIMDELEVIYAQNPYRLTARASYVNNPEAFDGVTGLLGEATDPQPLMGMQERKGVLALLTFGPNGSLYETEDSASGEPASWAQRLVARKCGLVSVWGIAEFEEWFCWTSDTGLRIYDGGAVDKISQEVQSWWDGINPGAKQFTVLRNDPLLRRLYLLTPSGTNVVPSETYVMDYRELNSAALISNAGTLKVSYSGKVITTDLTRKWSHWQGMTLNYCEVVSLSSGTAVMQLCGGTGVSLGDPAYSATYTLAEGNLSGVDADYGAFWSRSSYATYFFMSAEDALQMKLGAHRLLHCFATMNVTGTAKVALLPALNRPDNFGRATRAVAVTQDLARDLEFGLQLAAERISYRICGVGGGWCVSELTLAVKTHPYSPIRGRNSDGVSPEMQSLSDAICRIAKKAGIY